MAVPMVVPMVVPVVVPMVVPAVVVEVVVVVVVMAAVPSYECHGGEGEARGAHARSAAARLEARRLSRPPPRCAAASRWLHPVRSALALRPQW